MIVDNDPLDLSDAFGDILIIIHAGQTIHLRCSARGGNPVPNLTITKNGQVFGLGPTLFENTLQFVATALDHGANLSCSAQNEAVDRPVVSHTVQLNVLSKLKRGLHAFVKYSTKIGP